MYLTKDFTLLIGDFWGPLLFCLTLAFSASMRQEQSVYLFTLVFILVWGGAAVIWINAQLLNVPLSLLQTICRLGYALSPLAMMALTTTLVLQFVPVVSSIIGIFGQLACGGWSLWAGMRMVWEGCEVHADRKYLVLYPIILYYSALTILCILS